MIYVIFLEFAGWSIVEAGFVPIDMPIKINEGHWWSETRSIMPVIIIVEDALVVNYFDSPQNDNGESRQALTGHKHA